MGRIFAASVKLFWGLLILTAIFLLSVRTRVCSYDGAQTGRRTNGCHISNNAVLVRDLTTELNRKHNTSYDVVELMRSYGLEPKLLSRSVSRNRPNSDDFVVPNVVHFIHFGESMKFKFRHYLSVLGADKFIRPDYIFIHGDRKISGHWWTKTIADIPNLYHVWQRQPTEIHGRSIRFVQHAADFVRLQLMYGM